MVKINNQKIVFLILHYIVEKETIKCVESIIENIDTPNYEIVIVDNASPNNSYAELKNKFSSNKKIHLLQTEKNLGFTGGNNVGFKFAKELNADYICMMNNDTYLIQKDFFNTVLEEYNKSKFGVLGPEIHLPNGKIEKVQKNLISLKKLKLNTIKLRVKLIANFLHLENVFNKLDSKRKSDSTNYLLDGVSRTENVVLHGCCLVFSPKYIKKFDGLDQKTFLYREEEFLYLKIYSNNMISVYNPKLKIFHNEMQSTMKVKKTTKSIRFRYKNLIKANQVLIKELRKR